MADPQFWQKLLADLNYAEEILSGVRKNENGDTPEERDARVSVLDMCSTIHTEYGEGG